MSGLKLEILSLGGTAEYGRNSIVLKYGNDALLLDCGINVSCLS